MARVLNTETTTDGNTITTSYVLTPDPVLDGESLNDYFNELNSPADNAGAVDSYEEPSPSDDTNSPVEIKNMVLLSTLTNTTVVLPDIDIYTYYVENEDIDLLNVFISDYVGIYNGVSFDEGKLIATFRDDAGFNIYVNSDGTLTIEDEDAAKYSIDAQTGELQYIE